MVARTAGSEFVIALGPYMRERILASSARVSPERVHVVPVWVDGNEITPTPRAENPLVREPGIYVTHHVGASTEQAQVAIAHEVIRIVQGYLEKGSVANCVNRQAKSSATHVLSVRHRNRPGVLAHVFDVLAQRGINVEEVENIIYHGAQATLARIHLDTQPDQAAMAAIASGNADVIKVDLSRLEDGA